MTLNYKKIKRQKEWTRRIEEHKNPTVDIYSLFFFILIGEKLIQYASENLVTEILIHPQTNTFIQCMRNLLSSFTRHRHIIHAGYTFTGNGSWILQVC